MPKNLHDLSILIVTWHGDELLANCLGSIQHACGDMPEIIVVDNANENSTRQIAQRFSNVRYISAMRNLGFAGGNNLGLMYCTRKNILLLNNDTIIHEEPFSFLIKYLEEHPKVGIVQGTMNLPLLGNTLDSCGFLLTGAGGLLGRYFSRPTHGCTTESGPVYAAKGACLLFKRDILSTITGPMFHSHFFNNGEETDFCYRTWMSGYEVHYINTKPIDHLYSQTVRKLNATANSAKSLSNVLFSYFTTLSWWGIFAIMPGFFCYHGLLFIRYLLGRQWQNANVYVQAIRQTCGKRKAIRIWRKKIQDARKTSDREILSKILVRPSMKYYYLEMRGKMMEYIGANWKTLPTVF